MADLPSIVEAINDLVTRIERVENSANGCEIKGKQPYNRESNSHVKNFYPFVTQYHPALPSLERILMGKWHLIQNQLRLREIFKEPSLIFYRKGKPLKDLRSS